VEPGLRQGGAGAARDGRAARRPGWRLRAGREHARPPRPAALRAAAPPAPRVVTSDGEYHSARRQLDRLVEEGLELSGSRPTSPRRWPAARARVDDRTALVVVSHVLFESGRIVPGLGELARACERAGAALLVDAYHAVNVVPLSLPAEGLSGAFVVGGGYKYLQLGEGNAFLRVPAGATLRPAVTGWFAEFDALAAPRRRAR